MLCENCKTKPMARGIKTITCPKCGEKSMVNCDYQICKNCSDKLQICQYCVNVCEFIKLKSVDVDEYEKYKKVYECLKKSFDEGYVLAKISFMSTPMVHYMLKNIDDLLEEFEKEEETKDGSNNTR